MTCLSTEGHMSDKFSYREFPIYSVTSMPDKTKTKTKLHGRAEDAYKNIGLYHIFMIFMIL
jgi:hypothetical protein